MEKAVSNILQPFMIHEQSGRGRNGTKEEAASCDPRHVDSLERSSLSHRQFRYHKRHQPTIHYNEHSTYIPKPRFKKTISLRAPRTVDATLSNMSAGIAVRLLCYPTSERIPCHVGTTWLSVPKLGRLRLKRRMSRLLLEWDLSWLLKW